MIGITFRVDGPIQIAPYAVGEWALLCGRRRADALLVQATDLLQTRLPVLVPLDQKAQRPIHPLSLTAGAYPSRDRVPLRSRRLEEEPL
jgi:hypothetical protein